MNFITLESEQFRKFADKYPDKSFYQTPEIANLRAENGWTPYYFGVEENGQIKAASMVVAKPAFLGKSIYYAPGGPLINYEDERLTAFFFKNLKNYAKSHNGYILHIEPYYEKIARDRDGEPVEGGFNHEKALQNLHKLGFITLSHSDEPKYSFALELKDQTEEKIFANMKRNTRNHIRKAEKMGVKIRELKREELSIFKQITESTSARRNFTDKPLSYYEKMYDLFHPRNEDKFLVAEAQLEENISKHCAEPEEKASKDTLSRSIIADGAITERPSPVTTGARERSEKDVSLTPNSPDDREPSTLRNATSGCTPLSVAMFMTYGDEVIYLFSGSDEKYMKDYNAQYLIQWHMIKYALEKGYKRYNFYGIQGLPDKSSKDYGIYDFKKGFTSTETGRVVELLGAHELPVDQLFYRLHQLLSKIKHH